MKLKIKHLIKARFIKAGGLLTAAGILAGLLGYVYQILIGRMLTPVEFALFSAIISLSTFVGSPITAVMTAISRRLSILLAVKKNADAKQLFFRANFLIVIISVPSFYLLYSFENMLIGSLKATSSSQIFLMGIYLFFGSLLALVGAYLQATKRFITIGSFGVLNVTIKMVLSFYMIEAGFGVAGVLFAISLALIILWVPSFVNIIATFDVTDSEARTTATRSRDNKAALNIIPILLANISFTAMTQLDMFFVNYYFEAQYAGQYAAASVLGKAILYLPGGLILALLPFASENFARSSSNLELLGQALAVTALGCGAVALVYFLFASQLVEFLYGPEYAQSAVLLTWYGLAVLPMALVLVLEYFLIAEGKVLFAWVFLSLSPLQLYSIKLWHSELWQIILIMGTFGLLTFCVGVFLLLRGRQLLSNFGQR